MSEKILASVFASVFFGMSAITGIPAAHADSYQIQNGGGTQSQSSDSPSLDKTTDYSTWPNGGGKVHRLAHVDKSAQIDAESKVGPFVDIEGGARIQKSLLGGESESKRGRVGESAVIKSTSLQGAFTLEKRVTLLGSTLQGPLQIKEGVTLRSCTISAMAGGSPAVIQHDMSNEMKMYPEMKGFTSE